MEVLYGKLTHFAQHCPPISLVSSELLFFLRSLLKDFNEGGDRKARKQQVPLSLRQDIRSITALVRYSMEQPFPIISTSNSPIMNALKVVTDASGHIIASPSLGIFSPSQSGEPPLVASLAFPRNFLLAQDSLGHKAFCKTTTLECLGLLGALGTDPLRFAEKEVVFFIDNYACVIAFKKGYSRDEWATTVIRAARVVAAGIGCTLYIE